jgi:hypothetical protein
MAEVFTEETMINEILAFSADGKMLIRQPLTSEGAGYTNG